MDVFERVREVNAGAGPPEIDRSLPDPGCSTGSMPAGRAEPQARSRGGRCSCIAGSRGDGRRRTATVRLVVNQSTAPAPRVEAFPSRPAIRASPAETIPTPAPTAGDHGD